MRLKASLAIIFAVLFGGIALAEKTLTVSAAASLKEALNEIKTAYAKERADVGVAFNFGGSGLLQQQIEQGAPVDVFISAAPKQMDALEKKDLLQAGSRRNLLTNVLVLITPKNSTLVAGFADLTKPAVKHVIIGDPKSVPAGMYAAEVFAFLKIAAALEPKLVRALDVRQVLATVETGNAEAGVVYRTDAKASENVQVVAVAPAGAHSPIIYAIGVIKASKQPQVARAFALFLTGETGQTIFTKHGFGTAP